MMNLVRLKKGIKLLLFCLLSFSCNENKKVNNENKNFNNEYVTDNFVSYRNEYEIIKDSIQNYKANLLTSFVNQYLFLYEVDSMICFNSKKDKLVSTINVSVGSCVNCRMDNISGLLGKKINGNWYFFLGGGHLKVPRDMFGKDAMHPLSFYELSQIARKNYLSGAIIKNNKGQLIVNDKWVDSYFEGHGVCAHCKTKAQYDSTHWFDITDKWKHKIDTNEYKPLRRKQHKKVNS